VTVVGTVAGLWRYPVKSMAGEALTEVQVDDRGLVGDRLWAACTEDGGIGSGKRTRRFRRVDGLLDLRATLPEDGAPWLHFPDGRALRVDDPQTDAAISAQLGQPLRLRAEGEVRHHDESPVHLVTDAALRSLEDLHGEPVDVARFRPNLLLDLHPGATEDDWAGRALAVGDAVVLRVGDGMPRCLMVGLPQPHDQLPEEPHLLRTLGLLPGVELGQQAHVVRGGQVAVGDAVALV
jgi:uncharacterized protein YcbX